MGVELMKTAGSMVAAAVVLSTLVLGFAGCSDVIMDGPLESSVDGDPKQTDNNTGGSQKRQTSKLSFDVETAVSGPRVVIEPTKTGDKEFTARLFIHDFTDLFGIATHLRYDPKGLKLVALKTHEVLAGSGYGTRSIGRDIPKGRVLLGAARYLDYGSAFGKMAGAKVGKQLWATLEFEVLTTGKHDISFDKDATIARRATYEIVAVAWPQMMVEWQEATQ